MHLTALIRSMYHNRSTFPCRPRGDCHGGVKVDRHPRHQAAGTWLALGQLEQQRARHRGLLKAPFWESRQGSASQQGGGFP